MLVLNSQDKINPKISQKIVDPRDPEEPYPTDIKVGRKWFITFEICWVIWIMDPSTQKCRSRREFKEI